MKKIFYFLTLALALAACKPQPTLQADKPSLSVDAAGGTQVINITANYPWTASTSTSWIKLKASAEENTLTVTINRNNETDGRKGSITLMSEDLSVTVEVVQAQRNAIELDSEGRLVVSSDAQNLDINLHSNVALTATVTEGADWVTVVSTKAMLPHVVTLSLKANTSRNMRRALVTFSDPNNSVSQQIMIDQDGKPQVLQVGISGVGYYQVPLLTGLFGSTMTAIVFWDGEKEAETYSPSLTHSYELGAKGSLRIEAHNAESVSFASVKGVDSIDLSEF